jgi:Tfp pilus assembly protein PilF
MKEKDKQNINRKMISDKEIYLFLVLTSIVILLHVWGTIQPSHLNWGAHLFAFYPDAVTIGIFILMFLSMLPIVHKYLLHGIDRFLRTISRLPLPVLFTGSAGCVIAGAFFFQVKMHLLGDGAVLLRSNAMAEWGNDLIKSFSNQPLMRLIYRWVLTLHPANVAPSPHDVYLWIDIGAGVFFIGVLFWFFRKLEFPLLDRVLMALFLILTASTQFFFGYIENYVLQFVIGLLFLLSGWTALRNKTTIIVPILCYGIIIGLHLGFLILAPSVLFLVYWKLRDKKTTAMIVTVLLLLAGIGFLYIVGFNARGFLRHITSGSVDFLQPFTAIGGNFPYPMFSFWHAWDWLNGQLLVAPSGLVIAISILISQRKQIKWNDPVLIFLLLTTFLGLLFTWIVNFALGMARDWDLFSTFLIPLLVLDIYLCSLLESSSLRRYILLISVIVTAFHWTAWIGINADGEKHLARMKLLNDPKLLSPVSQMVFDEALANYFFDGQDYPEARVYYEHFMTIDNHNPRIIGNMADTYRKLGLKDKYFGMLQHAIELHTPDPGIYSNIGVEYANRGDTTGAIAFNEKAVAMDSTQRLAHANLGILYATRNNFILADKHFTKAIELGMRDPQLFRYAGDISVYLGQLRRALQYYNAYLEIVPGDQRVLLTRNQLLTTMRKNQIQKQ